MEGLRRGRRITEGAGGRRAHVVSLDIDLGQAEESVGFLTGKLAGARYTQDTCRGLGGRHYGTGLDDLPESQIHPGIAHDQMAVEGFAILQLDEHRVALGGREQTKRKLRQASATILLHGQHREMNHSCKQKNESDHPSIC